MSQQRFSHQIYRIDPGSSPIEDAFLNALQACVGNSQAMGVKQRLVVVSDGDLNDESIIGLAEQTDLRIHHKISEKLRRLSRILHQIATHNLGTLWVSAGDCTGIWWEVSQAFSSRIWFGESRSVGFPEARSAEISPLGIFAKHCVRNQALPDLIVAEPTITTRLAFQTGWLDAVFPNSGNLEIGNLLDLLQTPFEAQTEYGRNLQTTARRSPMKWQDLAGQRREDRLDDGRANSSLQILRELVRAREPVGFQQAIDGVLIPTRVRELIIRRRARAPVENRREAPDRYRQNLTIQVQASGVLPTTATLARMFRHRVRLGLFDANPTAIVRSSEVIDGRLRKLLNDDEIKDFRENLVIHFQSSKAVRCSPRMVEMELHIEDRISCQTNEGLVDGYCLEGHEHTAILGPLELSRQAPQYALHLCALDSVCDSLIFSSWAMGGSMPLSVWSRCMAIEAIALISKKLDCGPSAIIQSLRVGGWRFLGDEARILKFLKYRLASFPSFDGLTEFGDLKPSNHNLGLVNDALLRKVSASAPDRDIAIEVNLATKVVAGTILAATCEFGGFANYSPEDALVSAALGFPTHGRSIRNFLTEFGVKRTLAYAREIFSLPEIERVFVAYSRYGKAGT